MRNSAPWPAVPSGKRASGRVGVMPYPAGPRPPGPWGERNQVTIGAVYYVT